MWKECSCKNSRNINIFFFLISYGLHLVRFYSIFQKDLTTIGWWLHTRINRIYRCSQSVAEIICSCIYLSSMSHWLMKEGFMGMHTFFTKFFELWLCSSRCEKRFFANVSKNYLRSLWFTFFILQISVKWFTWRVHDGIGLGLTVNSI